jgi:hypothetical protein
MNKSETKTKSQPQSHIPVTPTSQEAEPRRRRVRGLTVQSKPGQLSKTLSKKKKQQQITRIYLCGHF